ncbi:outer membrane autotransporter protein [Inquilinus ginsengisoli]|uniref:autotransporter outer membrane beta-barrel domain-containing protein n=1 Tax=Inquilinus ginsengisoli TaxID=363840 RepID=UPI003D238B19
MTRGQHATLSGDSDRGSAHLDSVAWQLGAQAEVGAGLLLGASLSYQTDWFGARDGVSATGSSAQGAVTLKYQTGLWLLTGALFGSVGDYDIQRHVAVPGFAGTAESDAEFYIAGLRARAAYTVGTDHLDLRPYLNLDLVHARNGSFSEDGVDDLGLRVDQSEYSTAILTPAVELGSRLDLSDGMVLRSFVSAGVSLRSNDTWKGDASFNGGQRHQGFALSAPMDEMAARVGAGVQLFQGESIDVRVQCDGEIGSEATRHGGTATFAYRF